MRFKLYLKPIKNHQKLIFNYQYPIQAWIYKMLANADEDYASFLHNRGYEVPHSRKTFKHYTFSSLQVRPQMPIKKGETFMHIASDTITLQISFMIDKAAQDFVTGLFAEQELAIYNRDYRAEFFVERIEAIAEPDFRTKMVFKTASPMVVATKNNGLDQYLSPEDDAFAKFFAINLIDKHRSLQQDSIPLVDAATAQQIVQFKLIDGHIKKRGFTIKEGKTHDQTKVIGYDGFCFELSAPAALIETGYWSGFGKYNSIGCGYVEIV